jgi:hypothetical protein
MWELMFSPYAIHGFIGLVILMYLLVIVDCLMQSDNGIGIINDIKKDKNYKKEHKSGLLACGIAMIIPLLAIIVYIFRKEIGIVSKK